MADADRLAAALQYQQELVDAARPASVYGVDVRNVYPGEDKYFKDNPHVSGMAAEDNKIILNPYSNLSEKQKQAVMMNESARVHMREGKMDAPRYDLSPEQASSFSGYGNNLEDQRQTIAARILSGDSSALQATPEQLEYVGRLRQFMGIK
jgi:hypothetical protein